MPTENGNQLSDKRLRLLEAAGEVFAEQGFRQATIREICRRANANIAAVNYYFRDKEGLYAEVLRRSHCAADGECSAEPPTGGSPEQRLRAFVRAFLLRLFDPKRPAWHGLLMARELFEPTAALDMLVEESIRPRYERLLAIVRELLGPEATDEAARRCAYSVVGQFLFYHHGQHLLARLEPDESPLRIDVERLVEHVTRFSLGGLKELARGVAGVRNA